MFPKNLSDLEHLINNPMIRFKEELVKGHSFTIVSYMIGNSDLWKIPMTLECRGHTYNTLTGECVCAPFSKFFNVNEREDTQRDEIQNLVMECQEKRDGSMILPVLVNDEVLFKTKKTFFSDVANLTNKVCPDNVKAFCKRLLKAGVTPIFEFNHPDCRIVLDYGSEPQFTLLAIRNFETGQFYSYDETLNIIHNLDYDISLVERYNKSWDEIISDVNNFTDIEGYVLLLSDGRRVKIKTKWYLELHRTMTELRVRDVAEMVADETVDDCKSLLSSQGKDLKPIENIDKQVTEQISEIRARVEYLVSQYSGQDFKSIAIDLKSKNEPVFGLVMYAVRGKEPDYVDYWKNNFLKEYSLRGVYNSNF